mgnify:CR=1 FL=1
MIFKVISQDFEVRTLLTLKGSLLDDTIRIKIVLVSERPFPVFEIFATKTRLGTTKKLGLITHTVLNEIVSLMCTQKKNKIEIHYSKSGDGVNKPTATISFSVSGSLWKETQTENTLEILRIE